MMSLNVFVKELTGVNERRNSTAWTVTANYKSATVGTSEADVEFGMVTFNQMLQFLLTTELQPTDLLNISVFEVKHVAKGSVRLKVGEFSMLLQAAIEHTHIEIEDRIIDSANNKLLKIGLRCTVHYEAFPDTHRIRMSDSSDEEVVGREESPLLQQASKHVDPSCSGSYQGSVNSFNTSMMSEPHSRTGSILRTNSLPNRTKMAVQGASSKCDSRLGLENHGQPVSIVTTEVVDETDSNGPASRTKIVRMFRKKSLNVEKSSAKHNLSPTKKLRMAANMTRRFIRRRTKDSTSTVAELETLDAPDAPGEGEEEESKSIESVDEIDTSQLHPYSRKNKLAFLDRIINTSKHSISQDYQLCITVLEIRKLQGLNLNPMVVIQVGDEKRKTSYKESTNCPFFDEIVHRGSDREYFVFDFNLPQQSLLEKIITFTVYNTTLLTKGKVLGQFKIEVATVYAFPGHQVHHKWAPLAPGPDDQQAPDETRGYLQCDIFVTGKDSSRPAPEPSKGDESNFEKNLLLPPGCGQFERQKSRIHVKIYRAEDLPFMNMGIIANVKKAFTGEATDLVDPYVQVSFGGVKSRTSVKKGQCSPVWNEELLFSDSLPALCSTIQIQLKDKVSVTDDVVGTYYIDLMSISNTGTMGFMPTFGPCWVNLYGSNREVNVLDEHRALNSGQGEGIAYRGRLLVAVSTQAVTGGGIMDDEKEEGETNRISAVPESIMPKKVDMMLIGCIFEANNINTKYKNQPVQFELSIGSSAAAPSLPEPEIKEIQRKESTLRIPIFDNGDRTPLIDSSAESKGYSESTYATVPKLPCTHDKSAYYIDYPEIPCLYVHQKLEDNSARMFSQNLSAFLSRTLSQGIADVKHFLLQPDVEAATSRLLKVIGHVAQLCIICSEEWKAGGCSTNLDKERRRVCRLKLDYLASRARTIKSTLTMTNVKDKLRQAQDMLVEMDKLSLEPQDSLPDVFVWMLVADKRIAYFRLPAKDILYSDIDIKKGNLCSKMTTVLLKLPGKRSQGSSGWQKQATLTLMLWLGLQEDKDKFLASLPPNCTNKTNSIPRTLACRSEHKFQLRAHLYQARALIGSDSSGLSDPYAVITFGEYSAKTKVIYETLSPTWNQMLIIDDITLPFPTGEWLKACPPIITIEFFDHDTIGSPEYLGRVFAYPLIKLSHDKYEGPIFPALLQWWHIMRGQFPSGELLASFELFQKPFDHEEVYKLLLTPRLAPKHRRNASAGLPLEVSRLDVEQAMHNEKGAIVPIPGSIRPVFSKHRIEILFWGVRELKKLQFTAVTRPRIDVECAGQVISSTPITDANVNPNFSVTVQHTEVDLPEDQTYCPPITIRCVDCRNFGRFVLVGTHTISSLQKYLFQTKQSSRDHLDAIMPRVVVESASTPDLTNGTANNAPAATGTTPNGAVIKSVGSNVHAGINPTTAGFKLLNNTSTVVDQTQSISSGLKNFGMELTGLTSKRSSRKQKPPQKDKDLDDIDWSNLDWWSKYYASVDQLEKKQSVEQEEKTYKINEEGVSALVTTCDDGGLPEGEKAESVNGDASSNFKHIQTLKIYDRELEAITEFEGFTEWLHTFNLLRGKKTTDEEDDDLRLVGKFKGCVQIYKCPPMLGADDINIVGGDPTQGMFAGIPSNAPVKVLVRVYIILARELHPADLNGKADPYLVVKLGPKVFDDHENYVAKQLHPVFGKCVELEVTFPMESKLTVQVWDYDLLSKNDMIGETKIDLENRYYSRHRAACGLPKVYHSTGYNAWRDREKPTLILAKLCSGARIGPPHYRLHQAKVTVNNREFFLKDDNPSHMEENLALEVLKHWHEMKPAGCSLVPEHVETRSLYNSEKPGVEQGKVQMWVDMFPMDAPAIPPAVDISPRKPSGYELRVIIWNTDEVILEEDDFFTGEKASDIYVKGWMTGPSSSQSTDVHYRSLTGEGNFNWRFVLPFEYLVAEQKLVVKKKDSIFSWDESETKMPAKLTLQVWDADHISADDFLGSFDAELIRFPRGAKSAESCKLDSDLPTVNIFKQKRIKGWWPFVQEDGTLAGKVEAEIELVTAEEAEAKPVGEAREAPEPLEKPNRPDTMFLWFLNPLKSMKYMFCKRFKKMFIKGLIICMILLLVGLLIYNIPGYTAKKMLGA